MFKKTQFAVLTLVLLALGCGSSKKSSKNKTSAPQASAASQTKAEMALAETAKGHQIPARLLTAVGYVESRLTFEPAYYVYGTEEQEIPTTLPTTQTAFGVSVYALGLTEASDSSTQSVTYREQISAYATWLRDRLPTNLNPNPKTSEEWFEWVWQVALLHRPESGLRREVRSLFVKEVLHALNEGFTWTDPESNASVTFPPQEPKIKEEDLSRTSLSLLGPALTGTPQVSLARLVLPPSHRLTEIPQMATPAQGIEVIHCPLSLSACFELATNPEHKIQVHYIIPTSPEITDSPVQTLFHKNQGSLLGPDGRQVLSDRILIMLVGDSGRPQGSKRIRPNPNWFSKWQLEKFGELVNQICYELSESQSSKFRECLAPGSGIVYHRKESGKQAHWGDLPDLDSEIVNAYALDANKFEGDTTLTVDQANLTYEKGKDIKFDFGFSSKAKRLVLEELYGCWTGGGYWDRALNEQVRDVSSFAINRKLYDVGPYQDGRHFYRLKVYGSHGDLIGWDSLAINIQNYDPDEASSNWICAE